MARRVRPYDRFATFRVPQQRRDIRYRGRWIPLFVETFDSFPSTGLLDDFNRSDENPLGNGRWSGPIRPSGSQVKLVSNQILSSVAGNANSYWSFSQFGPDSEVWVTVVTKDADGFAVDLALRIQSPGAAGVDAYWYTAKAQAGTDIYEIYRVDNNSFTLLGATETGPELVNGDKIGFKAVGDVLTGYVFQNGRWTSTIRRQDSTYGGAGYIGIQFDANVARGDDFGGGTVGTIFTPRLSRNPAVDHRDPAFV